MNFNVDTIEKIRWKVKCIENKIRNYRLSTNETHIVETECGKIKGVKRLTVYEDEYYSFEGIPYAQAPLNELRFKSPKPPQVWEHVKDCCGPKSVALQMDFISGKVVGSEDCLYLNVYTNNLKPEIAYPVLVYIHGGGFIFGEATRNWYGPDYFIKKNIVLITIQYRLGIFGFLSLKNESLNIPGNAGLKDQILALKWIKNNCSRFGGNPENITVCGESAGAASTSILMLSEAAKGLFHRAILMSGNILSPWAQTSCQHRAHAMAKLTGYQGEGDDKTVLEHLQKVKISDLIKLEDKVFSEKEQQQKVMFAFAPTVEPYKTDDCVIPKDVREMFKSCWGNDIPVMTGFTSYEGLFLLPYLKKHPELVKELDTCLAFVPTELQSDNPEDPDVLEIASKIKEWHVNKDVSPNDNYLTLCSYPIILVSAHQLLYRHFKYSNMPVYLYRFDFDSENLINPFRIMRCGRGVQGVAHCDELSYLFWNMLARRLPSESLEYKTICRMIDMWYQFASTGNPHSNTIDGMEKVTWEALSKTDDTYKCLNIGKELEFIDLPEMDKLIKWQSLYDKHKELF